MILSAQSKLKGITITEFTMVLPFFLLLVFGIIQGGILIFTYSNLSHVAKDGVRYAVVRGNLAGSDPARVGDAPATASSVTAHIRSKLSIKDVDVTVSWPGTKDPGQTVTVQVSHDVTPQVVFIPAITITASASGIIHY